MRTKHSAKESSNFCTGPTDPMLTPQRPFGSSKHSDLRKNEGKFISARGKSKCASVKENSRSGATTPRCTSESPSPKCEMQTKDASSETPRTYLIKDSFSEAESKLPEQHISCQPSTGKLLAGATGVAHSPKNVITCASPIANANRFLSEIEEVEWFYDGNRLVGGLDVPSIRGHPQVTELPASCFEANRVTAELEEDDRFHKRDYAKELWKLKGKAVLPEEEQRSGPSYAGNIIAENRDDGRGKAPMAFPTEEEHLPRFSGATRCHLETQETQSTSHVLPHEVGVEPKDDRVPCGMPGWFANAYSTLAKLDDHNGDQNSGFQVQRSEEVAVDMAASSSSRWQSKEKADNSLDQTRSSQDFGDLTVQATNGFPAEHGEDSSQGEAISLGERVQSEIRKVVYGESDGQEASKEVEEEDLEHGQQGPGWLWKMSLCASVSFVTWVLVNGARIQCRSIVPTIREREQPLKIVRRRKKFHEPEDA